MNPLKIIKNGIIDENPTFSRSWYGFIYNSSSYLLKYCYFFN